MAILNMFGGGGGVRIPLEPVSDFALVGRDQKVLISWTDPVDKVASPGGEKVAEWAYTVIVRKEGSYPTSILDGVQVVKTTVRNQYSSAVYTDSGLTNGVTYYYAAYSCSKLGVLSDPTENNVLVRSAMPVLQDPITLSDRDDWRMLANTENHAIIFGGQYTLDGLAIDSSLTETALEPVDATAGIYGCAVDSLKGYAFFTGGDDHWSDYECNDTYVYSPELVMTKLSGTKSGKLYGQYISSASGKNAIIYTGDYYYGGAWVTYKYTQAVDTSMTFIELADNPTYALCHHGGNVGDYAVMSGGYDRDPSHGSNSVAHVMAFDSGLTRIELDDNSVPGASPATLPNHILFAGGNGDLNRWNGSFSSDVIAYTSTLTKITGIESLTIASGGAASASIAGYALFAGGVSANLSQSSSNYDDPAWHKTNCYDSSLTKILVEDIDNPANDRNCAMKIISKPYGIFMPGWSNGASVGDYAFVAGHRTYAGSSVNNDTLFTYKII